MVLTESESADRRSGVVVALMGATATGKSTIALDLAQRLRGEIINCDALQIYQGLDIGTAKPSADDQRKVEHHLFGFLDPRQSFSAGQYADLARSSLKRITPERTAILVGGTGLYYRALTRGLAQIPPIPKEIRLKVRERAQLEGALSTHQRLQQADPVMASKIHATDRQRTQRALEIIEATGKSQSQWIEEQPNSWFPWTLRRFVLTRQRSLLYDRIERRAQEMFDGGWIDEVRDLLESGVPENAPAFQAIGYRQIIELLQGRISEAEALNQIRVATRRYAKRQETWFRKEPDFVRLSAEDDPSAVAKTIADTLTFHLFPSRGSQ